MLILLLLATKILGISENTMTIKMPIVFKVLMRLDFQIYYQNKFLNYALSFEKNLKYKINPQENNFFIITIILFINH